MCKFLYVFFYIYETIILNNLYVLGAVVGLAVGMAVVAFILGFGAIYMFYKRNGGSFVKSDKPMDNPAYENAS